MLSQGKTIQFEHIFIHKFKSDNAKVKNVNYD